MELYARRYAQFARFFACNRARQTLGAAKGGDFNERLVPKLRWEASRAARKRTSRATALVSTSRCCSQEVRAMTTSFGRFFPLLSQLFPARRRIRPAARRPRSRFQSGLFLEALEDRRLLASDLSIVKTGPVGTVAAGSNVTYTIVVSNAGPDLATATVADTLLSANITGATFTSTATGGGTGFSAMGT